MTGRTRTLVPALRRRPRLLGDDQSDPMEAMGSLFDVAVLLAVVFLIVALSGFGLEELFSAEEVTLVKNPGTPEMELIRKRGREIERLAATDATAEGSGTAIGTVYQLEDGSIVWIPSTEE
ncbi:MAG: DUF2149 domain-containing protein [Actinomycetota bacterium]|nr:DUF2149 domain-containing protein [Actinomycetota bacterium]